METNNKLREALSVARMFVKESSMVSGRDLLVNDGKHEPYVLTPKDALKKIDAALAAPARNCDVGTAEEQYKRFMNMCNSKDVRQCAECSMRGFTPGCSRDRCFANWAQMPYEEGGAK